MILAGISIQALTNQGIFGRANEAKRESEIASIKEQIALDIYEKQLVPPLGSITEEQLEEILGKYGTVNKGEDETIIGITTEKGYEILLKDIYVDETVAESVPDGAIVTPVNDITTWLKTAGISKQYSYTTIEQVIADTTCTQSLMNNENAMKYLARSTEFADAICTSETTMTYLGDSAYVDYTVLNSDLWVNALGESQYYDKIFPVVTVHSSASAIITFNGNSFVSDASGNTIHSMPWGTYNISDSVSGKSFERTITKETTDVYVMPEKSLYWYGYVNPCGLSFRKTTPTFNTNYLSIIGSGTYDPATLYTNSKIDITGYTKSNTCHEMIGSGGSWSDSGSRFTIWVDKLDGTIKKDIFDKAGTESANVITKKIISFSDIENGEYILQTYPSYGPNRSIKLYYWYLE